MCADRQADHGLAAGLSGAGQLPDCSGERCGQSGLITQKGRESCLQLLSAARAHQCQPSPGPLGPAAPRLLGRGGRRQWVEGPGGGPGAVLGGHVLTGDPPPAP